MDKSWREFVLDQLVIVIRLNSFLLTFFHVVTSGIPALRAGFVCVILIRVQNCFFDQFYRESG